jgi:DNA invertase Pin-like site-specific DNA recombinase
VSTEEQAEGHSLDAQRRAIEHACQERGWTIERWYADEGVSAHTDDISKRPAFHQLIQDAQAHRFDAVVVHKLDRWARSVVVALQTFKLLSNLGITFLSLSESGLDFTSPMGKVLFGLLALFAEYYSENLGLETKKGKAERRAKGLHNGLVPFGYRSKDGSVAEPDPETADGARLAFRLAAEGMSLRQIAQALNAAGYRTAGNMRRGMFTKDTVRDMLANRFYVGELPVFEPGRNRHVRSWEQGRHTPLIVEATFAAAQAAIRGRASSAKTRRDASIYSLSGLLRCTGCGERLRVMRTEKGRVRYHCRNKAQGLGCSGSGSFLDVYERQLADDLRAFRLPPDWKQQLLALAEEQEQHRPDVECQRRELEARRARLVELFTWGDLSRAHYQAQRDAIDRELAVLAPVEPQDNHVAQFAAYLDDLTAAWADADQEQRNQLANAIYEEVWVNGPRVEYVKPRPELEPLFTVREGAAQPVAHPGHDEAPQGEGLSHSMMAQATPMGIGFASANIYTGSMMTSNRLCGVARGGWACRAA